MLAVDKDGNRIAIIRRDFWGVGVEICCMQSLYLWLRGGGSSPVTWETLLSCLEDIDCLLIAKEIREELEYQGV